MNGQTVGSEKAIRRAKGSRNTFTYYWRMEGSLRRLPLFPLILDLLRRQGF